MSDRLFTRDFVLITAAQTCFMLAFGATLPVLPRYVSHGLGGSDLAVGVVVGSYAFAAIALRPIMGRVGDRRGRKLLILTGLLTTAVGVAAHVPAQSIPALIAARVVVGAGQGCMFVGASTLVNDLAPPHRRGEGISYFSVAMYAGVGLGPVLGEQLLNRFSFDAVWLTIVGVLLVGTAIATFLPGGPPAVVAPPEGEVAAVRRGVMKVLHPDGLSTGVVMFLGCIGLIGFNAFAPLHGEELGMSDVAGVFLLYSFVILTVRLFGSRLPDTYGTVAIGTVALLATTTAMMGMALWRAPLGLYVFAAVLAVGTSLLYPALLSATVEAAPLHQRSSAIATFSMFFELATALGGALLGFVAALSSYSGAFATAALFAATGVIMLHAQLGPRLRRRATAG